MQIVAIIIGKVERGGMIYDDGMLTLIVIVKKIAVLVIRSAITSQRTGTSPFYVSILQEVGAHCSADH